MSDYLDRPRTGIGGVLASLLGAINAAAITLVGSDVIPERTIEIVLVLTTLALPLIYRYVPRNKVDAIVGELEDIAEDLRPLEVESEYGEESP